MSQKKSTTIQTVIDANAVLAATTAALPTDAMVSPAASPQASKVPPLTTSKARRVALTPRKDDEEQAVQVEGADAVAKYREVMGAKDRMPS